MRRLVALAALLLVGCSHISNKSLVPGEPNTDLFSKLFGRFSQGHGCPISVYLMLTAGHMSDERPFDRTRLFPLQWGNGVDDIAEPVGVWDYRDLALLKSRTPLPAWFPISKEPPKPGDKIWLTEYNFDDPKHAYEERRLVAEVQRIIARNVIYVQGGHRGSSGVCLVNASGEVVGINSLVLDFGNKGLTGVAVGVWGETFEAPEFKFRVLTLEEILAR